MVFDESLLYGNEDVARERTQPSCPIDDSRLVHKRFYQFYECNTCHFTYREDALNDVIRSSARSHAINLNNDLKTKKKEVEGLERVLELAKKNGLI